MQKIMRNDQIFTLDGFLSDTECEDFIRRSEQHGYEEALIQAGYVQERAPEIRNNDRVIFDDPVLADFIFERVSPFLPPTVSVNWSLKGLNERFRYYRYQAGQYFRWHRDASFERSYREVSLLTLLLYLNDDFEGGSTDFHSSVSVQPGKGMAMVFPHHLIHQGAPIFTGVKYVLRTDVMYVRNPV